MAMTLWGLSLLGYACAGWLAARRKPGAAAPLLCLLLIPPCLVWAAQGRPAGYEAYGQAARLAMSAAPAAGIWLLGRPGCMARRRAALQAMAQVGMALLWGMIAAAKGGFPRAAGLLLVSLSGLWLLPRRWEPARAGGGVKLAISPFPCLCCRYGRRLEPERPGWRLAVGRGIGRGDGRYGCGGA